MKIKKGFLKRKIGGKYLVVSTEKVNGNSMFIELNETSSDIWDGVAKGESGEEIADFLAEKYGVKKEKALADVESLIAKMRDAGVIED